MNRMLIITFAMLSACVLVGAGQADDCAGCRGNGLRERPAASEPMTWHPDPLYEAVQNSGHSAGRQIKSALVGMPNVSTDPTLYFRFDFNPFSTEGGRGIDPNNPSIAYQNFADNPSSRVDIDPRSGPVSLGTVGTALSFDGKDDLVSFDDPNDAVPRPDTGPFTWALWIYPRSYDSSDLPRLLSHGLHYLSIMGYEWNGYYGHLGYEIIHDAACVKNGDACPVQTEYWGKTTKLQHNQWYHVVTTFDGYHIKLYVNGRPEEMDEIWGYNDPQLGQRRTAAQFHPASTAGSKFSIGSPGKSFDGLIDEVRVWNRRLSDAEVMSLYNEENVADDDSLKISTSPKTIPATGGSVTVSWSSTGAASCDVTGPNFSNVTGASGSRSSGTLTSYAGYTLTCQTPSGVETRSAAVTLERPHWTDNPRPASGATSQPRNVTLRWDAIPGAKSYDVYLGTSNAANGYDDLQGNQTGTSYQATNLAPNTKYYWSISTRNEAGYTVSDLWSFTTGTSLGAE